MDGVSDSECTIASAISAQHQRRIVRNDDSRRFDGGGSSCMWIYNASAGKGALVNRPCDSKGERSCMNYILVRKK